LEKAIRAMPKVELHVHLEGSIRPETLLTLARRHGVSLPANTVAGLRDFYRFKDFAHFVEIYTLISSCLRTPDDIELIAREFLAGQAAQNIVHSEVTYTAYTIYKLAGIPIAEQLAALAAARSWGEKTHGVTMSFIFDIAREVSPQEGMTTADFAIAGQPHGVIALGLGGNEQKHPPEKFRAAFARAREAGLRSLPHAGETAGAASIWAALREIAAERLGHGVRCLEDAALCDELRQRQVPLEVCPSSNVCLGVAPSLAAHPLPRLLDLGLNVSINSDDPPLFNTTLTDEYLRCAAAFSLDAAAIARLGKNAIAASYLPPARKAELAVRLEAELRLPEESPSESR
jgi:adenosine deaminase